MPARRNKVASDLGEDGLRPFPGLDMLERVWERSELSEDEAMTLAVSEQHALRAEQCAARG